MSWRYFPEVLLNEEIKNAETNTLHGSTFIKQYFKTLKYDFIIIVCLYEIT